MNVVTNNELTRVLQIRLFAALAISANHRLWQSPGTVELDLLRFCVVVLSAALPKGN